MLLRSNRRLSGSGKWHQRSDPAASVPFGCPLSLAPPVARSQRLSQSMGRRERRQYGHRPTSPPTCRGALSLGRPPFPPCVAKQHTHMLTTPRGCHEGAMKWAATQPAPPLVTTRSRARARHMLRAICRVAYTPQLNGPTPERSQNSSKRSLSCSRMRWRSSSRSSFCCSHLSHSSTES